MTTYISPETGKRLVKLLISCFIMILVVTVYVFWTDYQGRKHLVEAARAGCVRDVESRKANAEGWRIAAEARNAEGDIWVARRYTRLSKKLDALGNINCVKKYPDTTLIP